MPQGLGRFLSVDPITKEYPELTPYQFASNSPIQGIDLDGLELYKTNSYVGMNLSYDSKLKKVTSGTVYYRSSQLPDALNDAITAANTCEDCLSSSASLVASFKLLFKPPIIPTAEDAQMTDVEKTPSGLEAQNHGQPIVPQNKRQDRLQRKTNQFETPGIAAGNAKVSAVLAFVDLAGKVAIYLGNENMKSIVRSSKAQAKGGANSITPLINSAIQSNLIPAEYLNNSSLSSIANYMLYGEKITSWKVQNNQVNLVPDNKLTDIANKLLDKYNKGQSESRAQQEQQAQSRASEQQIDNTKVKN